jgi:hypothetical protein
MCPPLRLDKGDAGKGACAISSLVFSVSQAIWKIPVPENTSGREGLYFPHGKSSGRGHIGNFPEV